MAPSSLVYCQVCGAAHGADDLTCFVCGTLLEHAANETEHDHLLLGRYQILTQIGTGGFGVVYKARDTHVHEQIVAIKQINLRGLTAQQAIEATASFNRELELLSTLSHPHLPQIHDHFTDPEHWYLVMDFIEGETLEDYLHDTTQTSIRTLPVDEVLEMAGQLCCVFDYLHTRQPPIIFRDLKPANIMRTPGARLVLIDFGIARCFKPGQSRDTIPLGSPGYAAPEQYGKAQTTPRADIYSLGALLHHLLSTEDPTENPLRFAPLRPSNETGLRELETLIMCMVALDAEQRPASIQEISAELDRLSRLREEAQPRIWRPFPNVPSLSQVPCLPSSGQQQQQMLARQGHPPSAATKGSSRRSVLIGLGTCLGTLIIAADIGAGIWGGQIALGGTVLLGLLYNGYNGVCMALRYKLRAGGSVVSRWQAHRLRFQGRNSADLGRC